MGELEGWVDTKVASQITGYSIALIARLARKGQVRARRVGRAWLVNRDDVLAHQEAMSKLGNEKHNPQAPWRDDLVAEERGRPGGETERTD